MAAGLGMDMEAYKKHIDRLKSDPEYAAAHKEAEEQKQREWWMTLKPFASETDVPHLPKMTEFFINRLIALGAIPKKDLEDGVWYYGNYRNTVYGKWNSKTSKFDHYRYKFGYREDDCNHFEDDNGYALFVPLRKANETELIEIKEIENAMKR